MKLMDVSIRNFGSFEGQHPPFRIDGRGLVLVLGENLDEPRANSNASGKSTLLDAIDWCLFGEVPRGDAAGTVVNERQGRDCEVSVRLERDDGSELLVVRSRDVKGVKNGVRFSADMDGLDSKKTQERLEAELGLNREVFHAAVMFAQFDEWRFADATDAERKALLTKIVPELSVVDEWLANAKTLLAATKAELLEKERALEITRVRHTTLCENDPRPLLGQWEQARAQAMVEAQGALVATQTEYAQESRHLANLGPVMEVPPPPQPPPTVAKAAAVLQQAQTQVRAALGARAAAEAGLRNVQATYQALVSGRVCPTCGQDVPQEQNPDDFLVHVRDSETAFQNASAAELRARQDEQTAQQAWQKAQQQYAQEQADHHALVNHVGQVNQGIEAAAQRVRVLEARAISQSQACERMAAERNPHEQAAQRWLTDIQKCDADMAAASMAIEDLNVTVRYLQFWETAFGPRGVKSHILDSSLQAMSDEANRWLYILFGGTVWVRFETQTKVGKGKNEKLVDTFNVRVFRHNPDGTQTERSYRSWSGGEKHRISTGIDFGLARLVAGRAERQWDVLFLDEIFGKHLDASGKEAVAEMLRALMAEKSSIFVVDHDPRFQGMFEETVVVQKQNGASRILEAA